MADPPRHRAQAEGDNARDDAGGEARPGAEDRPRGVFGNLPKHRPGTRSPRRSGAEPRQAEPAPREEPEQKAEEGAGAASEPVRDAGGFTPPHDTWPGGEPLGEGWDPFDAGWGPHEEGPRPREESGRGSEGRGLGPEDLAWAAIAIAAQAATLGVRLANRALGALMERPERR